jgi:UDP-3-O-[3-hydroxymyristoyl] glucosamine N-acyltransferase
MAPCKQKETIVVIKKDIVTTKTPKILDNGTVINRFSHVVAGADIGANVMVGERCYIAAEAIIGEGSRIQNGVDVWDGVQIGRRVFVGPSVRFTNHHDPSILYHGQFVPDETIIKDGAVLCAASVIIAPRIIGERAFVGAASLVLRDMEDLERGVGEIK